MGSSNNYSVKLGIKLDDKATVNIQKELNEKLKNEKFEVSFSSKGLDDISKQLNEISTKLGNVSGKNSFKKTGDSAKEASKGVDKLNQNLDKTNKHLKNQAFATDNWAYNWSKAMQSFLTYNTVTQFFNNITNGIKDMIMEVKELDDSLTELKKVTDLEGESLNKFVKEAYAAGAEVAKTGKEMVEAATSFAKAGYGEDEILQLGKVANMYTNIADEEISAADSADFIIAQLKAFKLESEDVNKTLENSYHIIDAVNEVSNNYAVSSADIATNMGKASAVMSNAGNSMEQMIGLMTAGTEITRNASKVANGLKTITLRLQGMDDEGKESLELQAQMEALFRKLGISVYGANGELKNTYDILATLAPVYKDLSNAEKAYVTETIAGKYQAQNAAAILMNWGTAVDATTTALNSNGSAARENEAVLDSMEGHLQKLSSAWSELANALFDSGVLKGIIDLGTGLLKVANNDGVKFIATMLAMSLTLKGVVNAFSGVKKIFSTFGKNIELLEKYYKYTKLVGSSTKILGDNFVMTSKDVTALTTAEQAQILVDGRKLASSLALKAGIGILSLAITAGISLWQKHKQAEEDAIQKTLEDANKVDEKINEIDDSVSKIQDLRKVLSDSSSSYEDSKNAREELIKIQNNLIKNYGAEADKIDLVSGSIEDQIKYLKELKKESADSYLRKHKSDYNTAEDKIYSKTRWRRIFGSEIDKATGINANKKDKYTGERIFGKNQEKEKEEYEKQKKFYEDYVNDYEKIMNRYGEINRKNRGTNVWSSDNVDSEKKALEEWQKYLDDNENKIIESGIMTQKEYDKTYKYVSESLNGLISKYQSYYDTLDAYNKEKLVTAGYDDFIEQLKKEAQEGALTESSVKKLIETFPGLKDALEDSNYTIEKIIKENQNWDNAIDKIGDKLGNEFTEDIQKMIENNDLSVNSFDKLLDKYPELQKQLDKYKLSIDDYADKISTLVEKQLDWDTAVQNFNTNIDSLQDAFSTLSTAQEEYNDNGYISIDTLQSLLDLDDKYLSYLVNENGQLNLNEDAFKNLARAKINDLIATEEQRHYNAVLEISQQNLNNTTKQTIGWFQTLWNVIRGGKASVNDTKKTLSELETEINKSGDDAKKAALAAENETYGNRMAILKATLEGIDKNFEGSFGGSGSSSKKSGSKGSGSKGSGSSSKSKEKEWWEKEFDALKDQFDYSEITIEQYINGLEGLLGKVGKGSEAWKKINKELQKQRLDKVKDDYDSGRISLDQYIISLQNLQQAYKAGTDAWNDLADAIKKAKLDKLKEQQDDLKSALSAVNNTLDKQIDKYEEAKEAADKKYDDEIDKLEELQDKLDDQNDDYERAQQAVADYLDEQMSAIEKQRDTVETYYDNVLNAIAKMNEKQQESLELAEAYEALMNAMTQKTKKVKYMLSIKIAQNGETPEKDNPVGKIYFKYIIMKGVELWLVVKDTLSKNLKINY